MGLNQAPAAWDLNRLRAFVVVARHESVTRAAVELSISQSPLSRQMIALEEELGFALFVREKQRVRLNAAGRSFLEDAKHLLAASEAARHRAAEIAAGRAGPITIGYVDAAVHTGVLQRDLATLRAHAPDASVRLLPLSSSQQASALRDGTIDIGYAHRRTPQRRGDPAAPPVLVAEEPFVVAVPDRGPWKVESSLTRIFAKLPWVSGEPHVVYELRQGLERLGIATRPGPRAHSPSVVLALVAAGEGVALVQSSLRVAAAKPVRFLDLPGTFGPRLRVYRTLRTGRPWPSLRAAQYTR